MFYERKKKEEESGGWEKKGRQTKLEGQDNRTATLIVMVQESTRQNWAIVYQKRKIRRYLDADLMRIREQQTENVNLTKKIVVQSTEMDLYVVEW